MILFYPLEKLRHVSDVGWHKWMAQVVPNPHIMVLHFQSVRIKPVIGK